MKKAGKLAWQMGKILVGGALFSLGFNLFLQPNGLNAGGLSGLAMILVHVLGFGTAGAVTAIVNLPLFLISARKLGKKFLLGSIFGTIILAIALDMRWGIPIPQTEPLIATLYGGVLCGAGLGLIFISGATTGGSDIVVRLIKLRYRDVPIGTITILFDLTVAVLTGLVFHDISRTLYSGVATFVTGKVIDAVVYRFDYSKVAMIISEEHERVAEIIHKELNRGATFLYGQGAYSGKERKVILTAVKRQQLAQLKELVVEVDPNAFIIVQEAHQVLGDGFARYSKDSL